MQNKTIKGITKVGGSSYRINFDDNTSIIFDTDVIVEFKLSINKKIDIDYFNEVSLKADRISAKQKAYKFLNYKLRSESEVRQKLKDYSDLVINETIEYFKNHKLIDDYEYAKAFINDKVRIDLWGSNRIINELKLKGINELLVNEIFDKIGSKQIEEKTIKILANKLIKKQVKKDFKARRRVELSLFRYGYDFELIKKTLDALFQT